MKKTKIRPVSTFDRLMKDPIRRRKFEKGYKDFLLSEILCEAMEKSNVSVRVLAAKAELSPTVIQEIRSGKKKNTTLNSISNIFSSLGYKVVIKKRKQEFVLSSG